MSNLHVSPDGITTGSGLKMSAGLLNGTRDPIEQHFREILKEIGEDPEREGLLDTPKRVAKMYREIFAGLSVDPARHLERQFTTKSNSMVVVKDLAFSTVCEHHFVPFVGVAHVGYIPGPADTGGDVSMYRVAGLSKFARVIDDFAARPQVQENLTDDIAQCIQDALKPQGVIVVMKAQHFCMSMRGVKKPGAWTVTSSVRGIFYDNTDGVKDEFYKALER